METNSKIQSLSDIKEFLTSGGGELASLPLLIFFCLIFGSIAKKIHLPSITGYMVGGLAIGHGGLDLISEKTNEMLTIFIDIALGLMVLSVGTHINFHRLKNSGKRILFCSLFDNIVPFFLVYGTTFYLFELPQILSFIFGAISISTAPATTIALVIENRAKGTLVNTLLPMVAVNNVSCIFFYSLTIKYFDELLIHPSLVDSIIYTLKEGGADIIKAIALGCIMGYLLKKYSEKVGSHRGELLTGIFFFVMATIGISKGIQLNPMLPSLFMGIYITNMGAKHSNITNTFEEIQHIILLVFFGVAGSHIQFESFASAGWIVAGFVGARLAGKLIGASLGAIITKSPTRLTKYLGFTTVPQAGVAIGLVLMAEQFSTLQPHLEILTAVVILSVNINEIIGPIMGKIAFIRSGEAGQDREKLIDFLGEEFIHPNLKSKDKESCIEELTKFLIRSHNLSMDRYEEYVKVVHDRELEQSTGIGNSVAIPHGIIDEEEEILGVLGLSREGIDFGSPDKKRVHLIILLLTPKDKSTKHLKILAEMVKLVGDDYIRKQLFNAKTAAELYEVIHHEEHSTFNYFLEDQ